MDEVRISRRWLVGAGAVGTLGALLAPGAVLADDGERDEVELLRWDMTQTLTGVLVPGGVTFGVDTVSLPAGDTVALTGSGQANPKKGTATGGGTFINRHADGRISAKLGVGIYYVTGFNSFVNGGGSLTGSSPSVMDTIGEAKRTTGGVLSLKVHALAVTGQQADATLEIHVSLPGGQADAPGFRLTIPSPSTNTVFQFEPLPVGDRRQTGSTLFHVLER
jgi:hypothetical protein